MATAAKPRNLSSNAIDSPTGISVWATTTLRESTALAGHFERHSANCPSSSCDGRWVIGREDMNPVLGCLRRTTGAKLQESSSRDRLPDDTALLALADGSVWFLCDHPAGEVPPHAYPACLGAKTEVITQDTRFASAASLDNITRHVSVPNVRCVCLSAAASPAALFQSKQGSAVAKASVDLLSWRAFSATFPAMGTGFNVTFYE